MKTGFRFSILCLLGLAVPFLDQAFHVDDPFFVALAEQILRDWKHPFSFDFNSAGAALPVFQNQVNPPLQGYYLAAAMRWLGRDEWALHAACFLFVPILFAAMVSLGKRFHAGGLASAWLLCATPAVLVMSHTCMPDIGLAAFYTAAMAALSAGLMGLVQYYPAVRRILLLLPAWILLYLRRLNHRPAAPSVAWVVFLTLMLGLAVSFADTAQADLYRRFAREELPRYCAEPGRVWSSGHWGFQYYCEQAGVPALDVQKDHPQPGDRVVVASQPARSNFYSNVNSPGWMIFLPFAFSNSSPELFVIRRVEGKK